MHAAQVRQEPLVCGQAGRGFMIQHPSPVASQRYQVPVFAAVPTLPPLEAQHMVSAAEYVVQGPPAPGVPPPPSLGQPVAYPPVPYLEQQQHAATKACTADPVKPPKI
jgi:hypothetical protein